VEGQKTLWDAELRDMQEVYDPILVDPGLFRIQLKGGADRNRRKFQRFGAHGEAQLLKRDSSFDYIDGSIKDLSEVGCLVSTRSLLVPGTDLKLVLHLRNYDLTLKGSVRHAALDVGLGVEFQEIRKGDRAVLRYIVEKLAEENESQGPLKANAATLRK